MKSTVDSGAWVERRMRRFSGGYFVMSESCTLAELERRLGHERFQHLCVEAYVNAAKTSTGRREIAKSLFFETGREYISFMFLRIMELAANSAAV